MEEPFDSKDDLELAIARHREIQRTMPAAWSAFFARFRRLTPIQLEVAGPVFEGRNVLVSAPTAGGKTEAVVAPLCERMIRRNWSGMSALLVTPTRALVNDLYTRLETPCLEMGVKIGRKTADHSALRAVADNLLVTTPESLESLLTFRRSTLSQLRAVVVDEIHLLDGGPRGDQLRLLLQRLRVYLSYTSEDPDFSLQVVAMSATIPDPERTARAYLGPDATVVEAPGQRPLDARVIVASGGDTERAAAAMRAVERFGDVSKVLVFVNSRQQVDAGAKHFRSGPFANAAVYGHHGSLSKAEREQTEEEFRSARRAVCVATPTLEVGIDIGDVDLVICMDPPFSLASFLQRLGRGGRRGGKAARVLCVARDRAGELLFEGMIRQSRVGLPPTPAPPFRRSVLLQQVLAYLRQVDGNARRIEQFERVFCSSATPAIEQKIVRDVLDDMERAGLVDRLGDVFRPASAGQEFIESTRIYANIAATPGGVAVVDAETGKVVAHAREIRAQSGVSVGGRSYELLPGGTEFVAHVRAGGAYADAPLYRTRSLPYAADVGASVAGALGIEPDRLLVLKARDGTLVLTWLGRLANTCLARGLTSARCRSSATSFAIKIEESPDADVLELLGRALESLRTQNPLGAVAVEKLADLGPHVDLFTEEGRQAAREDWLDVAGLRAWLDGVREARFVEEGEPLARDLEGLARL